MVDASLTMAEEDDKDEIEIDSADASERNRSRYD